VARAIDRTVGFRVTPEDERGGLDLVIHAESAYEQHATSSRISHLA